MGYQRRRVTRRDEQVLHPVSHHRVYLSRMRDGGRFTFGALADAAGVGRETVHFYVRQGLVADPPRSPAGYRLYAPKTVARLRFIRGAQELGFTLSEISELSPAPSRRGGRL